MWLLCAGFLHIGGICNIICEAIHFAPAVLSNICRKKVPTHCMEDILFSGMASNKYGFSTMYYNNLRIMHNSDFAKF